MGTGGFGSRRQKNNEVNLGCLNKRWTEREEEDGEVDLVHCEEVWGFKTFWNSQCVYQRYASCLEIWAFRESRLDWDLAVKFEREYGSDEKLRRLFLSRKTPRGIVFVDLKTLHTKAVLSSRIQKKTVAGLRKRMLFAELTRCLPMFTRKKKKKKNTRCFKSEQHLLRRPKWGWIQFL